jgi:hypothetical protein
MPQFDNQSAERISQTVQEWEHRTRRQELLPPGYVNQQWWRWFKLTAALAPGGTATANPVQWAASGTYTPPVWVGGSPVTSAGAYSVVTGTTFTVRDTTGQIGAGIGDWVLCRPIGNDLNVTVWEVLTVALGSFGSLNGATNSIGTSWTKVALTNYNSNSTPDIQGGHNGLSPATAGVYLVSAGVSIHASFSSYVAAGQTIYGAIYQNTSRLTELTFSASQVDGCDGQVVIPAYPISLAANDVVYLYARCGSISGDAVNATLALRRWQ